MSDAPLVPTLDTPITSVSLDGFEAALTAYLRQIKALRQDSSLEPDPVPVTLAVNGQPVDFTLELVTCDPYGWPVQVVLRHGPLKMYLTLNRLSADVWAPYPYWQSGPKGRIAGPSNQLAFH